MKTQVIRKTLFHSLANTFKFFCMLIMLVTLHSCTSAPELQIKATETRPVIHYFMADSMSITSGQPINLTWDISLANTISIEPNIGIVAASGTTRVYPTVNTIYTIIATNNGGEITASVNIKVSPQISESNCTVSACDPVSGRNQDFTFTWEQLCLCTEYRLQIAKDPNFSMLVYDRNNYSPYSTTSPGFVYLAGGILECGHTYYVRVRCLATATGQRISSPWSILGCITIGTGFPVSNPK